MSRSANRPPATSGEPVPVPRRLPPHAPELGPMRRLLGAFHVTGIFWYRIHRWGMKFLPEWGLWLFIIPFTTFFFVALRRIRKAIAANLAAVLGPCGWWRRQGRIYRTMWNFAWCLSERYERLATDRHDAVETIVGQESWDQVLASEEGVILVTAHIGHWEVGAMRVPGRHVHVVREEEMDPKAQEFLGGLFAELGDAGFTMHFVHGDPTLGPRLLQALRSGAFVALQGDRPRSSGRSSTAELFGRPLELPAGPAALARAAGVAMLPVYVFRRGRRRSEVVFRPPIRVAEPGAEGLAAATRRIAAEVEWAIRRDPFQWFCFRELWPGDAGRRLNG